MTKKDFDEWYDKIMEQNSHMTWVSNCYWYLEDYSCVLVPRNKNNNIIDAIFLIGSLECNS